VHLPGYYEYCCRVKIISGVGALEKIPPLLTALKAARPMIITDKGVVGAGLLEIVNNALTHSVTVGAVGDDVPPDSDIKVVHHLARVYREHGCDSLIAVGGGSVMDTAKGINIVVSEKADDLMRFAGVGTLKRPLRPLIAVPTTAGTGSEVTLVAVVADHDKKRKMFFTSYFLLPDAAVLDPRMTLTLPAGITAATAMDALSHAMEAYTCLAKNPLSDAGAYSAVSLIGNHLIDVIRQPDDREGRLALANAATLAGMAFSNSMVGMVHTLGHAVGAVCRVPHGVCMAIMLPYGLEYNMHKNGHFTAELLLPLAGSDAYARTPKHLRAEEVVNRIRRLNRALHDETDGAHPRCFKEVVDGQGRPMVPKDRLGEVAEYALNDVTISYNPEELDRKDLLAVIEAAWEGIPLARQT